VDVSTPHAFDVVASKNANQASAQAQLFGRILAGVTETRKLPTYLVVLVTMAAIAVFVPLLPWIALALWIGIYLKPLHRRLVVRLGGRSGVAATLSVSLLLVIAIPIALLFASIVLDAIALVRQLWAAPESHAVFVQLVQTDPQSKLPDGGVVDLLLSQGDRALAIAQQLAGVAADFVIGLLVMVSGTYGVLVNGEAWYAWLERHLPVGNEHLMRFRDAFVETGRGLWFGIVGTGMVQSIVATIAFLALGVPSALALGMMTLLFSLIPAIGTALVWVPVAAGLALSGRTASAIILAAIGVGVISTVDNLARPWLTRRGKLQLPTWVVLISMFGGVELIGGWGLLMGPLVVRLAKEAMMIAQGDAPETASSDTPVASPPAA
jgi:predicted PurR-regulated permease PerM